MSDSIKKIDQTIPLGAVAGALTSSFTSELSRNRNNGSTVTYEHRVPAFPSGQFQSAILKVRSFKDLQSNWDSYGAEVPTTEAIRNSIDFLLRLSQKQQTPYFITPSPDGDILIKLKEENVSLEFVFFADGSSEVSGYVDDELHFEKALNETTELCSLKWLYCPDGDCNDW